jgi:hypothetical protein
VYRWKRREIEKISLSAFTHSFALKSIFLPLSIRMFRIEGKQKKLLQTAIKLSDMFFGRIGNVIIVIIFKCPPTKEQREYLSAHKFYYKINQYPK